MINVEMLLLLLYLKYPVIYEIKTIKRISYSTLLLFVFTKFLDLLNSKSNYRRWEIIFYGR